jgi:hypothetical protein
MSDIVLLENLKNSSISAPIHFSEQEWSYVLDQNSGQYTNNQITYNTLATSQETICWSRAYLEFNVTITVPNVGTQMPTVAATVVALKQPGVLNLIDSVSIQMNGETVNNQISFLNVFGGINQNLEWSKLGAALDGPSNMFAPDSSDSTTQSIGYSLTANNNVNTGNDGFTGTGVPVTLNKGLASRAYWLGDNKGTGGNQDTVVVLGTSTTPTTITCKLTLPLAQLHPFFKALDMPLRGTKLTMYLNLNSTGSALNNSTNLTSGSTNPFIITSYGQGLTSTPSAMLAYHTITATRLYYPIVKIPSHIDRMTMVKQVDIVYPDYQLFPFTNQGLAGGNININISNGISNVTDVIIFPMFSATGGGPTLSSLQTRCEPGVTSYGIELSQVQLQVNGRNFMQNNITTGYEMYKQQISPLFSECGADKFLHNGVSLSFDDWIKTQQYYWFDVTRNKKCIDNPDIPSSYQFICNNITSGGPGLDFLVFLVFKNAIKFDQGPNSTVIVKGSYRA